MIAFINDEIFSGEWKAEGAGQRGERSRAEPSRAKSGGRPPRELSHAVVSLASPFQAVAVGVPPLILFTATASLLQSTCDLRKPSIGRVYHMHESKQHENNREADAGKRR